MAAPACARAWRRAGGGEGAIGWAELDASSDLKADAVFDCRGLRPNLRQASLLTATYSSRLTSHRLTTHQAAWTQTYSLLLTTRLTDLLLLTNLRQAFDDGETGRFGLPAACESRQVCSPVDRRGRLQPRRKARQAAAP